MSFKAVNLRYGTFMLVSTIIAALSYTCKTWLMSNSTQIIMVLVCIVWFHTIKYRVIIHDLRRLLCAMSVMLAGLFLITVGRYNIFLEFPIINRYLNYFYQLPVLLCALFSCYSAVCVGAADTRKAIRKRRWMAFVCVLLILGYLTNDLHHLAYRSVYPDGGVTKHFIICWLSWAFQVFSISASFIMILRRSRISNRRKLIWLPILFLVTGAVMLILCVANGHLMIGSVKITFQNIYAFMLIGFWESCIIIGLVPSNSRYILLMNSLPINMQITNTEGELKYDSAKMSITAEQRNSALSAPVMLAGYTLLNARSIPGGFVFWTEDRSKIETLNQNLRNRIEDLKEKNALLQQENEIKEDKTRYEVQSRTYSRLASDLEPTADKLRSLLSEGDIPHACVIGAYIKRSANLYLLAEQNKDSDISELYHSIKESLETLQLLHITCAVYTDDIGTVPSKALLSAYDYFENIIERELYAAKAVMVILSIKKGKVHITVNISDDDSDGDEGCFTSDFGGGDRYDV